jgi:hypothetical protein
VDSKLRAGSKKSALALCSHPPTIAHGHWLRGQPIGANHMVAAANSTTVRSRPVAIECAGVMLTCTNKFSPCGHNFGRCLARIAIKGAVDISSYTRFQRTGPRWCPTSSAGAAEPTGPSARTWEVRTWHAQRPTTRSRAACLGAQRLLPQIVLAVSAVSMHAKTKQANGRLKELSSRMAQLPRHTTGWVLGRERLGSR